MSGKRKSIIPEILIKINNPAANIIYNPFLIIPVSNCVRYDKPASGYMDKPPKSPDNSSKICFSGIF
jgi:hypothetical protein